MLLFYQFCSLIDDIVDSPKGNLEERKKKLKAWKIFFLEKKNSPHPLATKILRLKEKYKIPTSYLLSFIEGCEMDLNPKEFITWEDLSEYTYRVAGIIGLITLKILEQESEKTKKYALALGNAMQITNILRDINEDYQKRNRIYLPREEMKKHYYQEKEIAEKKNNQNFQELIKFQSQRAKTYFQEAKTILSPKERKKLIAPETMRITYENLLRIMQEDKFQIFTKKYRLSLWQRILFLWQARNGGGGGN